MAFLEDVAARTLQNVLGAYFHGIEKQRLKVDVFDGKVVLRQLRVREDALAAFELPYKVRWGLVGTLTLKVPWSKLGIEPVEVVVDEVLVIVQPIKRYDQAEHEAMVRKAKEEQVQAVLLQRQKEEHEAEGRARGFFERLEDRVLDQLTICVTNLHVRYEDDFTAPERPFAVGLTLSRLMAYTTSTPQAESEGGVAGSGDRARRGKERDATVPTTVHKRVELETLAVYWNSEPGTSSWCSDDSDGGAADVRAKFAAYLSRPAPANARVDGVSTTPLRQQTPPPPPPLPTPAPPTPAPPTPAPPRTPPSPPRRNPSPSLPSPPRARASAAPTAAASTRQPTDRYVLAPISAEAQLSISKQGGATSGPGHGLASTSSQSVGALEPSARPQVELSVWLRDVRIALHEEQYQDVVTVMVYMDLFERWCRYRKWRPALSAAVAPRAWWTYAGRCIRADYEQFRARTACSWAALYERNGLRARYIQLHARALGAALPWSETLGSDETAEIHRLEYAFSVEEILTCRARAAERLAWQRAQVARQVEAVHSRPQERPSAAATAASSAAAAIVAEWTARARPRAQTTTGPALAPSSFTEWPRPPAARGIADLTVRVCEARMGTSRASASLYFSLFLGEEPPWRTDVASTVEPRESEASAMRGGEGASPDLSEAQRTQARSTHRWETGPSEQTCILHDRDQLLHIGCVEQRGLFGGEDCIGHAFVPLRAVSRAALRASNADAVGGGSNGSGILAPTPRMGDCSPSTATAPVRTTHDGAESSFWIKLFPRNGDASEPPIGELRIELRVAPRPRALASKLEWQRSRRRLRATGTIAQGGRGRCSAGDTGLGRAARDRSLTATATDSGRAALGPGSALGASADGGVAMQQLMREMDLQGAAPANTAASADAAHLERASTEPAGVGAGRTSAHRTAQRRSSIIGALRGHEQSLCADTQHSPARPCSLRQIAHSTIDHPQYASRFAGHHANVAACANGGYPRLHPRACAGYNCGCISCRVRCTFTRACHSVCHSVCSTSQIGSRTSQS